MRIHLRPTVREDIAAVTDEELPCRIKAITALAGDKVLGLGGIGWLPDGTVIAFAHVLDEARRYPVAIHRAGLAAMQMIRDSRVPRIVAEAQPGNPAAEPWLLRLGFRKYEIAGAGGVRHIAFVWERQ